MQIMVCGSHLPRAAEGSVFQPEDLERMRNAFEKACKDRIEPASSHYTRTEIAKAIILAYKSGLTEDQLALAAIQLLR